MSARPQILALDSIMFGAVVNMCPCPFLIKLLQKAMLPSLSFSLTHLYTIIKECVLRFYNVCHKPATVMSETCTLRFWSNGPSVRKRGVGHVIVE